MKNYPFDMDKHMKYFPLVPKKNTMVGDPTPFLDLLRGPPYLSAEVITSPGHLCVNEQLREFIKDQVNWGPAVPVDVFVMAEGEPADRHVTKIGGLPYRPGDKPWPRTAEGQPMTFLAQFCFSDSKDLTGELSGDILLIFTPGEGYQESLVFEWYSLGLKNLVTAKAVPPPSWQFPACYGHLFRTVSFPRAEAKPGAEVGSDFICRNISISQEWLLFQYQATQIGCAPFFIQFEDDEKSVQGRLLCTLNSVQPAATDPFPWVNHHSPLYTKDQNEWPGYHDHLIFGDLGSLYISMTEDGQLHYFESCY